MHSHQVKTHASVRPLSHFNFLFTGWRSRTYDLTMARMAKNVYRQVIDDLALLGLQHGRILDAGSGPGTLARGIARAQSQFQVDGVDLSAEMVHLANEHTQREQLSARVHFEVANIAQLPYADHTFDIIVSTFSMHHWYELEQPLRELYRVLKPGGRLLIYDFRFMQAPMLEKALANTPFTETRLEHTLLRTRSLPFALCRRFTLQKQSE